MGRLEHLLRLQHILAGLRVDAGIQVVLTLGGGIDANLEVAAPAQGGTDGAAVVFLRLSIERQHHLRGIQVGVARSVGVANHLHATGQRLLGQVGLGGPVAMQMGQPHVATAHGQMTRVVALQRDGFLLGMLYIRPCLDDVHLLVGFVVELHGDGQQLVLHGEGMHDGRTIVHGLVVGDVQLQVLVTIGMLHLNGRQMNHVYRAKGRQCREVQCVASITQLPEVGNGCAIVVHTQVLTVGGMQYHGCVRRGDGHLSVPSTERSHHQEQRSYHHPYSLHLLTLFDNNLMTIHNVQALSGSCHTLSVEVVIIIHCEL